jgi:hypothetical protein
MCKTLNNTTIFLLGIQVGEGGRERERGKNRISQYLNIK